jgi:hypothetical protein
MVRLGITAVQHSGCFTAVSCDIALDTENGSQTNLFLLIN